MPSTITYEYRRPGKVTTFYEEWLEMNMAMAMLFATMQIPESGRPPRAFQVAFWICVAIAVGLGPVFACMMARCPVP